MIAKRTFKLFQFVSSAEEAWNAVENFYSQIPKPLWHVSEQSGATRRGRATLYKAALLVTGRLPKTLHCQFLVVAKFHRARSGPGNTPSRA